MTVLIDGKDFSDCIEGISWKRNDVDGEGAGRAKMNARMYRARIAIKWTATFTCMKMPQKRLSELLEAIEPEFVRLTTTHPRYGYGTWSMYSNNVPATWVRTQEDGQELWGAVSFPMVEE